VHHQACEKEVFGIDPGTDAGIVTVFLLFHDFMEKSTQF